MKYIYLVVFSLMSLYSVAQDTQDEYVKVILDGKEVYMSTKTGEIKNTPATKEASASKVIIQEEEVKSEVTNVSMHKVQKGETLYAIAKKYGMSVKKLQDFNNLTNTHLAIGQELKIASTIDIVVSSNIEENYTVQKGDTLYAISRKYNMTISELKQLNNLSSSHLSIGQVLKVK